MPSYVLPKAIAYPVMVFGTGAYFFAALNGSASVGEIFGVGSSAVGLKIGIAMASWAAVSYFPFSYETFSGKLILVPESLFGAATTALAILGSASFYTASYEGSLMLIASRDVAVAIGTVMFAYRASYAINAANLFHTRVEKVISDVKSSIETKDIVKGVAAGIAVGVVLGYAASTTDTSFDAFKAPLSRIASDSVSTGVAQGLSVLAACGTIPFTLYSTHRGLRQFTTSVSGQEDPPRDRYTYIATMLVLPLVLGALGAAMTTDGQMYSQLGSWTKILTLICSTIFAIGATMPSVAEMLRNKVGSTVFYRNTEQEGGSNAEPHLLPLIAQSVAGAQGERLTVVASEPQMTA